MSKSPKNMTEEERAEHYYAHREDPDQWGEPVPAQGPARLSVMISARFTAEESDQLTAAAQAAGMTRSALVRQAALTATTGAVVDLERIRQDVGEAEHRIADARQALA